MLHLSEHKRGFKGVASGATGTLSLQVEREDLLAVGWPVVVFHETLQETLPLCHAARGVPSSLVRRARARVGVELAGTVHLQTATASLGELTAGGLLLGCCLVPTWQFLVLSETLNFTEELFVKS